MSEQPDEDEVWAEAARRSWAESVQEREADHLSAMLAEASTAGSEEGKAHVEELRRRLSEISNGQIDTSASADAFVDEQLHKLDEPRVRRIVEEQVRQLVAAVEETGELQPPHVTVSSLPSGGVNAICAKDPGDGSIHIFADAELMVFIQSLAKLICCCVRPVQLGPATFAPLNIEIGRLDRDAEFSDRLFNLYWAVVCRGRARMSKPWLPEGMAAVQSGILVWAMERFAIAHELAHALDGHLDADSLLAPSDDGSSGLYGSDQELEADRIAVRLCDLKAIHSVYPELEAIAPYVFLQGVALLEACQAVFKARDAGVSLTHPATPDRLEQLKTEYLATAPDPQHKLIRLRIFFGLDCLFDLWRRRLVPAFEAAKGAGHVPKIDRRPLRPPIERPAILGG